MTLEQRIARIDRHAKYGPLHIRGVAEAVNEARRREAWGQTAAANYFIEQAERYCGVTHEPGQAQQDQPKEPSRMDTRTHQ